MKTDKYFKIGMSILEETIKVDSIFEGNRPPVAEFIDRLAEGHIGIIEKYGSSEALNVIFLDEIAKYYNAILGIGYETAMDVLRQEADTLITEDDVTPKDCIIIYPCFLHERRGAGIAHAPVMRGFSLNENMARALEIDYGKYEEKDNALTSESIIGIIGKMAAEATKEWSSGHTLNPLEKELLKTEIIAVLMFENKGACKEEIIGDLAEQTNEPELKRLLEEKPKFHETEMGSCTNGL